MFQECYLENLLNNTIWLKVKDPLCNITQESDLSTSQIEDIKKQVCEITKSQTIESLSLLGNQLCHLPTDLSESITNLVYLNLSNNQLDDLPDSINILKKLMYLNLDRNKFSFIPNIVCQLDNLKTLTASRNYIKSVPKNLKDLLNLEDLNLSFNRLNDLPDSFANLNSIKNFSLSNNLFKIIPKCVANGMYNLQVFTFSQNFACNINVPVKSVNLIEFYAEKNFTCLSFPLWILHSKYTKLETVSLNDTNFKAFDIPNELSELAIKKLSMRQCKLFEMIVERLIIQMTSLEQLVIGNLRYNHGNNFWHLPIESLKRPSCLKEIDASNTGIPILPKIIGNLVNLTKMDVSFNAIDQLPDEICSLKNLKYLLVHKNRLLTLPANIGEMVSLRELRASYNNLYELPNSMESLYNLQYIDLYNNEFATIPEAIEKLSSLVGLDLEQNYFSTDGLSLNRDMHYENMRHVLRDHWSGYDETFDGAKLKSDESEVSSDNERRYSTSSSIEGNSSDEGYMCSYPEDLYKQIKIEPWDSSEDTADEFDPHECKEPRTRVYPPTIYKPFQRFYCPADAHPMRIEARVIEMLQNGTLVWSKDYKEGQFEDP